MDLGRDGDGQEAVLERVAAEDVGEARPDHGAEALVHEGPHRVLARRSAAEVASGDEHGRARGLRAIERELRTRRSVGVVAAIGEEALAEAAARGALQEARGDDLVGVDVVHGKDDGAAGEDAEGLHRYLISSRASVTRPVTAAAAAVRGLASRVRPPGPWRPSKLRLLVLTA